MTCLHACPCKPVRSLRPGIATCIFEQTALAGGTKSPFFTWGTCLSRQQQLGRAVCTLLLTDICSQWRCDLSTL
jgi:hypothetical protein